MDVLLMAMKYLGNNIWDRLVPTKYQLIAIIFVFNSVSLLWAADINDFSPVFENIALEEGLSNYHITSFCQDSMGYLWIGTGRGLNKYDGISFKQYFFSPDQLVDGPPYDYIDFVEYCNHHIFVFTRRGSAVLDQETDTWSSLNLPDINEDVPDLPHMIYSRVSRTSVLVLKDRVFTIGNNRIVTV